MELQAAVLGVAAVEFAALPVAEYCGGLCELLQRLVDEQLGRTASPTQREAFIRAVIALPEFEQRSHLERCLAVSGLLEWAFASLMQREIGG